MKTVLVTGGAGYLGSHLVRLLLQQGHTVRILDALFYGARGIEDLILQKKVEFFNGDICNIREMTQAIRGVDVVIALAAIVGDPACALDQEETLSVNYESTKVLVELCNRFRVKQLLFASSCSVYGANSALVLNEGSALKPVSLYAETRIMSEEVVAHRAGAGLSWSILRLATLFGWSKRMRFDLAVNILTAKAAMEGKIQISGGEQWRPFVHVRDAARAFCAMVDSPLEQIDRQIFNLGGNQLNHTLQDVAKLISDRFPGVQVDYSTTDNDKRDYRVSFDKLNATLGFVPSMSVADGISEMRAALELDQTIYKDPIHYNVQYIFR
jgi:nucleoside-diphosphate-sugar epimerase